jgi:hypothetical protein
MRLTYRIDCAPTYLREPAEWFRGAARRCRARRGGTDAPRWRRGAIPASRAPYLGVSCEDMGCGNRDAYLQPHTMPATTSDEGVPPVPPDTNTDGTDDIPAVRLYQVARNQT